MQFHSILLTDAIISQLAKNTIVFALTYES